MSDEQLSLFTNPNQPAELTPDDIAAKAARIAASARFTGDTRRASEATIDQGWGSEQQPAAEDTVPAVGAIATSAASSEELSAPEPYELVTVNIKGHTYVRAVAPGGEVLAEREAGEGGSKELYGLVSMAADKVLDSRG